MQVELNLVESISACVKQRQLQDTQKKENSEDLSFV